MRKTRYYAKRTRAARQSRAASFMASQQALLQQSWPPKPQPLLPVSSPTPLMCACVGSTCSSSLPHATNSYNFLTKDIPKAREKPNLETASTLIRSGANPSVVWNNITPLHLAAASGDAQLVSLLLASGASPHSADGTTCYTPLSVACMIGAAEVVKVLLGAGADPNKKSSGTNILGTALSDAPLHHAARHKHAECCRLLILAGAQVDATSSLKHTPLYEAAAMFLAVENQNQEASAAVVKVLLAAGADHGLAAADGDTPLLIAVRTNNTQGVKVLLEGGADSTFLDKDGCSCMEVASMVGMEVVGALIQGGCNMPAQGGLKLVAANLARIAGSYKVKAADMERRLALLIEKHRREKSRQQQNGPCHSSKTSTLLSELAAVRAAAAEAMAAALLAEEEAAAKAEAVKAAKAATKKAMKRWQQQQRVFLQAERYGTAGIGDEDDVGAVDAEVSEAPAVGLLDSAGTPDAPSANVGAAAGELQADCQDQEVLAEPVQDDAEPSTVQEGMISEQAMQGGEVVVQVVLLGAESKKDNQQMDGCDQESLRPSSRAAAAVPVTSAAATAPGKQGGAGEGTRAAAVGAAAAAARGLDSTRRAFERDQRDTDTRSGGGAGAAWFVSGSSSRWLFQPRVKGAAAAAETAGGRAPRVQSSSCKGSRAARPTCPSDVYPSGPEGPGCGDVPQCLPPAAAAAVAAALTGLVPHSQLPRQPLQVASSASAVWQRKAEAGNDASRSSMKAWNQAEGARSNRVAPTAAKECSKPLAAAAGPFAAGAKALGAIGEELFSSGTNSPGWKIPTSMSSSSRPVSSGSSVSSSSSNGSSSSDTRGLYNPCVQCSSDHLLPNPCSTMPPETSAQRNFAPAIHPTAAVCIAPPAALPVPGLAALFLSRPTGAMGAGSPPSSGSPGMASCATTSPAATAVAGTGGQARLQGRPAAGISSMLPPALLAEATAPAAVAVTAAAAPVKPNQLGGPAGQLCSSGHGLPQLGAVIPPGSTSSALLGSSNEQVRPCSAGSSIGQGSLPGQATLYVQQSQQQQRQDRSPSHEKRRWRKAGKGREGRGDGCVVCWETEPCVVLMPCKHMVLCEACSQLLQARQADCPMCRATVEEHLVVWQG